jgi:serine/threonine protein kinase
MRTMKVNTAELPAEAKKVLEMFPEFQVEDFNESGANGYVLLGRHEVLKQEVAIKIYFHEKDEVQHEPALLAAIKHDNVLKVLNARRLGDQCAFFMTPVANYGDLRKYLSDYNLSLSLSYILLCQLLSGLAALHAEPNKLVHRDIKPENLLVHDDKLFIADFGSVRQVSAASSKASASKHSILFRPPEAFGDNAYFNYSSDTYQAGLIGYLLLGGQLNNDLQTHLTPKERQLLDGIKGDWFEECKFVDSCIERRICTGKLLDWDSVPCFVPRRFVTALRRATTKEGSKYSNVSEFMFELQKVRATLPDWIVTSEGWKLTNWKGRDYLITVNEDLPSVMKRKHGNTKFITDKKYTGRNPNAIFEQLTSEIGLP